ncbi:hypothetical protein ACZ90_28230 [Streptomyces albus subsp. albus]|nr:hypothetical protein ACZ90_28230 [Streptomyces albus subsp. albus]
MYDWLLGGHFNYEADRTACAHLLKCAPTSRQLVRNNRWFLERVVRTLAVEHRIRQFIDFGSGLPTQRNVHQIAQAVDERCRVVYIDNDPVVLAHARSILDENDRTAVIAADMKDTEEIFGHPEFTRLVRPDEPVAALFVSVLQCLPDEDRPAEVIQRVIRRLRPGSFVVICQLVSDNAQLRLRVTELMLEQTRGRWGRVREKRDVEGYFQGLEIKPPGLVDITDWRPDSELQRRQRSVEWTGYGGLAEVPRKG